MAKFRVTSPDGKTFEINAPEGATQDQVLAYAQQQFAQKPSEPKESSIGQSIAQGLGNALAGGLRGAGSIGATLLYPIDKATDLIKGDREKNLSGLVSGKQPLSRNEERRQQMDEGLRSMGADPESLLYGAGKLGGEIAGTAGAGGLLAGGLAKVAPSLAQASPALIEALRSGGMSAAGQTGLGGMAARIAGGAASGGLSAGMVNPNDAGTGALIGGALPPIVAAAGRVGQMVGQRATQRLAQQTEDFARRAPLNQTIAESLGAGYVIPPNMVQPSFKNQVIESISGKQATQQIASARNERVTGNLVRQALGIPEDTPLTRGALEQLRRTAGRAYADVAEISPQAEIDLEALKRARNEANGWFQAYNRSARPDDLARARDARDLSEVLEMQLESHAANAGRADLIPNLQEARRQIAKTYTVGRALNDASGTIDARVLGRMHERGLPLSDGLDIAAKFASAFPTVAKSSQQVGSPAAHNLKSMASLLMGGGGMASAGPVGVLAGALPFVAPPAARSMMFRQGAQQALIPTAPQASRASQLAELLSNPELQQLLRSSAPIAAVQ